MRYYLGPTTGRDCRLWPEEKRADKGCGVTCDCPGVTEDLFRYHKYADMMKLYELNKKGLDDIWDEDWSVIQAMLVEREQYKVEKSEEAERIKNLLGNRTGALR